MDIINHLQAYLAELDEIQGEDFHLASKTANLGKKVQDLIEAINEYENEIPSN